jgi:hypothetical protein
MAGCIVGSIEQPFLPHQTGKTTEPLLNRPTFCIKNEMITISATAQASPNIAFIK